MIMLIKPLHIKEPHKKLVYECNELICILTPNGPIRFQSEWPVTCLKCKHMLIKTDQNIIQTRVVLYEMSRWKRNPGLASPEWVMWLAWLLTGFMILIQNKSAVCCSIGLKSKNFRVLVYLVYVANTLLQ